MSKLKEYKRTTLTAIGVVAFLLLLAWAGIKPTDGSGYLYLAFVAASIIIMVFACEREQVVEHDKINEWLTARWRKYDEKCQKRREAQRAIQLAMDAADPSRVTRRVEKQQKLQKMGRLAFGYFALLSPVACIVIGFVLKHIGNEAWPAIFLAAAICGAGIYTTFIKTAIELRQEKQQK